MAPALQWGLIPACCQPLCLPQAHAGLGESVAALSILFVVKPVHGDQTGPGSLVLLDSVSLRNQKALARDGA